MRGHVVLSEDQGTTWNVASVPVPVLLTAVHMHDGDLGWAVGHDATILRTRDGGDTWERRYSAPEEELPLLDVWFRDQRKGYAVGAFGYFLATEDGGDTWQARALADSDFHLNTLMPAGDGRLVLAGEAGVVYRSDDDGETWRELDSPYRGSWFGGWADGDHLLLAGLRGNLHRSRDGGATWTRLETGTQATLSDVIRLDRERFAVTALDGSVLLVDGNETRRVMQLPSRQGIATGLPLADGGLLLVGEFGVLKMPRSQLEP